jgi:peptidoglycan/LPS O-acetylase OafA/YrhL
MEEIQKENIYFKSLTGVRAIAAYMVYFHHYNPLEASYSSSIACGMIRELHIGVTLFFVLSGFLIAHRYSGMKNFSFRNYFINRVARIYPMYFILTTLTFVIMAFYLRDPEFRRPAVYLMNITFLKGFFDNLKFTGISQGWSLSVEEVFYLTAPLFFLLINRNIWNLILQPFLLILLGILLVYFFSGSTQNIIFGDIDFMFNYTFFGRCTEFFIGIGLALLLRKEKRETSFRYFTYLGIIAFVLSVFGLSIVRGEHAFGINDPAGRFINNFILPLFGVSLFFFGLIRENTPVSNLLSSKLFILLGKSSYIFYLIHIGVFSFVLHKITHNLALHFILMNVVSIILFRFLEEPMNMYLRKRFRKNPLTSEKSR